MSPAWMLQAILVGVVLGVALNDTERVAGWFRVPRRSVWAAAMLGSVALPVLALWRPGLLPDLGLFPLRLLPVSAGGAAAQPLAASGPGASSSGVTVEAAALWADPAVLLFPGWLAASVAMSGAVAWTYLRLRSARARAVPVELDGDVVRVTERVGPTVVGLVHPEVVVPHWVLEVPADERRLILLHEREHVAAGDSWLLLLGTLAVAAMPWNLPLWWQHRRLRAAVEMDCDARVLARGASTRAYGQVLIRTAGCTPGLPLLGPAWGDAASQLERRILAMTARRPSHPLLRSVPVLALAAWFAAIACDIAGVGGGAIVTRLAWADTPGLPLDTLFVTPDPGRRPPTASAGWVPARPASLSGSARRPHLVEYPRVAELRRGGGAWRAGVRDGDEVVAVNGLDARELRSLAALAHQQPGTRYRIRIRRDGVVRELTAELDPPGGGA